MMIVTIGLAIVNIIISDTLLIIANVIASIRVNLMLIVSGYIVVVVMTIVYVNVDAASCKFRNHNYQV